MRVLRAAHNGAAANLLAVLSSQPVEVAIVGGMIRPKWPEGADASHITERWKLMLSCTDRIGCGMVPDSLNICGANLAVRRSALAQAGGFPADLGRVGGRLISGEEAYLIARLRQQDIFSVYDDRFVVDHSSSAERMAPAWAVKRAFWEGFSHVRILQALGAAIPRSLAPIKLILSIPILAALSPVNVDYRIRRSMACGSLMAQKGRRQV